ncbi:hypothetical protein ACJMK2_008691 [Sinanodonta woodiana]|uniref:Protein quiver n=1 Tax=Sinanodonta woodiana TaxID=1069815 RepID=A0ABD3VQC3_SINWO
MQKDAIVYIFLLLLFLGICISLCYSDGLICYQCADSTSDPKKAVCQNYKRLKKDRINAEKDGKMGRYFKNCTDYNETFCVIELIMSRGDTFSYIRDCSDGKTFSIELNAFKNLAADNQTTCSYRGDGYLACVTLCNTDMCNGPTGGVTYHVISKLFMLLTLTFCLLFKRFDILW